MLSRRKKFNHVNLMTGTKPEDILFVCVLQFLAFSLKSDVSVSIGFV